VVGAILAAKSAGDHGFSIAALLISIGFIWFQISVFPAIDVAASARPAWLANHPKCATSTPRAFAYALYYYAHAKLPECNILDQSGTGSVR
jgi:hypothetical protein